MINFGFDRATTQFKAKSKPRNQHSLVCATRRAAKLVKQKARGIVGSPKPSRPLETGKYKPPKHKMRAVPVDFED